MTHTPSSPFSHIPPFAGDGILSLVEDFQKDPRSAKINLCIGVYLDAMGRLPLLESVRRAESELLGEQGPRPYLPMDGLPGYRQATQQLVFGAEHPALQAQRVATLQTVGGSGALKLGADFIHRYFPTSGVWVSDPTWENHHGLLEGAGVPVHTYPYYDPATGGLRLVEMLDTLEKLPTNSIVLLHASCHNPTGVDLTRAQWVEVIALIQRRGLIPFVDMAYQGFGEGLDEDAFAVRRMAEVGINLLVANSFSKNFSLYGERCGGLSMVCASRAEAETVLGQLKGLVRRIYSTPPTHGARIIARVLQNPTLCQQWHGELAAMRDRIKSMRQSLHGLLTQAHAGQRSFDYLLAQRGMFSYTGLTEDQVARLRDEYGIYLLKSGRMCMSGLSPLNVAEVSHAMSSV